MAAADRICEAKFGCSIDEHYIALFGQITEDTDEIEKPDVAEPAAEKNTRPAAAAASALEEPEKPDDGDLTPDSIDPTSPYQESWKPDPRYPNAKVAWTIKRETLETFFEPILPRRHIDALIDITHEVVRENLARRPIDYKTSIVERAINSGIVETELGTQWLTAGLWAGLRPDVNCGYFGEGSEEFEELYREQWRYLTLGATDEVQTWLQKIAENSEDREFLAREFEATSSLVEEGRKQKLLLECLLATQESNPVIRHSQSVIGHLTQMSEMNLSAETRDFIDYSKARNAAVTGQSDLAIQTYFRLRNRPFKPTRKIDVRYHLINASYALRQVDLYGTRDVSTTLKLSPDNDIDKQQTLCDALLGGFDAKAEIVSFCEDFGIDPENVSERSIADYVRRFNGPNGAKIIYFYHLEEILRTSKTNRREIEERYAEIVRMLQILSGASRQSNYNLQFTKDAWYPLVFLHSVAANMGHFSLMRKIESEILSFEGWEFGSELLSDVKEESQQGSFLTLLFRLNRSLGQAAQDRKSDMQSPLRDMHRQFSKIRFMPALSQNILEGIRHLGDEHDPRQEVSALARRGISHWNYIIGGGKLGMR